MLKTKHGMADNTKLPKHLVDLFMVGLDKSGYQNNHEVNNKKCLVLKTDKRLLKI